MTDLHIPASIETPEIRFEYSRHRLTVHGMSFPSCATSFYSFYTPIHTSLKDYLDKLPADAQVRLDVNLRHFDKSSAQAIRTLVGMLDRAACRGPAISVHWLHGDDDERAMEFGIDLMEEHASLHFNVFATDTA